MNNKWSNLILNRMIDKYERTTAYVNGEVPKNRIILNFYGKNKSDFSEYDIEEYNIRTTINKTVWNLSEKEYVFCEWMKGQDNHILSRIWLNFEKIDEIYKILNRKSKRDVILSVEGELYDEIKRVNTDWIIQFYSDMLEYMKSHMKLGNLLSKEKSERDDIYKLLFFIDRNNGSALKERVFSEKCFGNSKYFENNVKSFLLSILRRYISSDLNDNELLQIIGITKYPEQIEMCGKIIINSSNMGTLKNGFCIYSGEVDELSLSIDRSVSKIITIENRANYFSYLESMKRSDEIVIFHGGQYSPAKKKFFESVSKTMPQDCKWYHWGDIDYGGFSMLLRLRKEITSSIMPYRMSKYELEKYENYTQTFSKEYAEKLLKLYEEARLEDCRECLNYMVKHKIKLEQEAMFT